MAVSLLQETYKYLQKPLDIAGSYHFVIGGKGGIGKSFVARMLAEVILYGLTSGDIQDNLICAKSEDEISPDPTHKGMLRFYDLDPVNNTFQATFKGIAQRADLTLVKNGIVNDEHKMDKYLLPDENFPKETRIFDIGGNQYMQLIRYFMETGNVDISWYCKRPFIFHVPLVGHDLFRDTMKTLVTIFAEFKMKAKIIYWVNDYRLLRESELSQSIETFLSEHNETFRRKALNKEIDFKKIRDINEIYKNFNNKALDDEDLDSIFYHLFLATKQLKYQIILANSKSSEMNGIKDSIHEALMTNRLFIQYINDPKISLGSRMRLLKFFFQSENCIFREILTTLEAFFTDYYQENPIETDNVQQESEA